MKSIRHLHLLFILALGAVSALPALAQFPPPALPGAIAATFSCEVPAGPLEEAVESVTKAAAAKGIEVPTTLFATDVAELKVPRLKLRSVTAGGALALLAAAADCEIEGVLTKDENVVSGWMFKVKAPRRDYGSPAPGADPFSSFYFDPSTRGIGLDPAHATAGDAVLKLTAPSLGEVLGGGTPAGGAPPVSNPTTATKTAPSEGGMSSTSSFVLGMGGGAAPQTPVTRVYPIGLLLDETKPESAKLLVQTVIEILAEATSTSDEKPRTQPMLSFHDGTKLLVAKATPESQALIEQTLQAMTQNANDLKAGRRAATFRQSRAEEGSRL